MTFLWHPRALRIHDSSFQVSNEHPHLGLCETKIDPLFLVTNQQSLKFKPVGTLNLNIFKPNSNWFCTSENRPKGLENLTVTLRSNVVSNDLFFKCQKASPQFLLTKNNYLSHWYFCTHPQDCQNLKNVLTFTLHIHSLAQAWAPSLWEHCPVVDGLCQVLSLCFPAWGLSFTSRGHQNLDTRQNPWDRESSQLHPLLDGHLARIMNG